MLISRLLQSTYIQRQIHSFPQDFRYRLIFLLLLLPLSKPKGTVSSTLHNCWTLGSVAGKKSCRSNATERSRSACHFHYYGYSILKGIIFCNFPCSSFSSSSATCRVIQPKRTTFSSSSSSLCSSIVSILFIHLIRTIFSLFKVTLKPSSAELTVSSRLLV